MDQEVIANIEKLRENMEQAFADYQQSQHNFYRNLELWLWAMPILQNEVECQKIITEVIAKIRKEISETSCVETDITQKLREIVKQKLVRYRLESQRTYDAQMLDKISTKSCNFSQSDYGILEQHAGIKKLSPISRLLISLRKKGVSKKEIAAMLFVGPSQVTNYFKKLKEEMQEHCEELL